MTNPFDEEDTAEAKDAVSQDSGGDVEGAPTDFDAAKRSGGDVELGGKGGADVASGQRSGGDVELGGDDEAGSDVEGNPDGSGN